MKKNKFFAIIIITTALLIFSVSAVCRNCTTQFNQDTASPVEENLQKTESQEGNVITEDTQAGNTTSTQLTSESEGQNHNPIINSIEVSEGTIFCNSTVDVWVDATDPDQDSLSYNWEIADSDATIENRNSSHTEWRAPSAQTQVKIVVRVTDGRGGFTEGVKLVDIVSGEQAEETHLYGNPMTKAYDQSKSGILALGQNVNDIISIANTPFLAGDYSLYQQAKSYISFDISDLLNVKDRPNFTLISVKITINGISASEGSPGSLQNDRLIIKQHNFGTVDNSDYNDTGGNHLADIPLTNIPTGSELILDSQNNCPNLLSTFQNVVSNLSNTNKWYQIKLGLNTTQPFTGVFRSLVAFPKQSITITYDFTYTD